MDAYIFLQRCRERIGMMTIEEASQTYQIPLEILREYESWGLCDAVKKVMGAWQYDDSDLEKLSLIMTLHDIGFDNAEIETYIKLSSEESQADILRMRMLEKKRHHMLNEIHFREKQLERLDYLRHKIRKEAEKKPSL